MGMIDETKELVDVWGRVRHWSEPTRLALVTQILESVEEHHTQPPQRKTLADLIGRWDVGSLHSDEQMEQILEEERLQKHS